MTSIWTKLARALRAFGIARGGNVMITFAIATLPILATVGFAVDYSRANSVKAAMQAALDSTALMLSKDAATTSQTDMQTKALDYFQALFTRTEAKNINITVTYNTSGGSSLLVNGSVDVPTTFLSILGSGYDKITVDSSSTSKWGSTRLRVALVLDNTTSMADSGKMPALISATTSLLTQLQNAASNDGDVYVSIIPFVKDVNLGAGSWNSNYIYWGTAGTQDAASPNETDNSSWDANNGTCSIGNSRTRSSCRSVGTCSLSSYTTQNSCTSATGSCSIAGNTSQNSCTSDHVCSISGHNSQNSCTSAGTCSISGDTSQNSCTSDHVCSIAGHNSQNGCQNAHGTWTAGVWTPGVWTAGVWTSGTGTWTAAIWTPYAHNDSQHGWNGCVMDRGYPASPSKLSGLSGPDTTNNYDANAAFPDVSISSSLYPAEQNSSCNPGSSALQSVMGLNYDWSTMNTLVNNMSPNGNTNQAIGLQLGWLSLVGGGPFTMPAMDPNYQYQQVIILLTDGLNTQNRWTSTQSQIDAREQLTCSNFKAASTDKITNVIYTIQVNTGGDPTSTMLQNCASNKSGTTDHFFLLTAANQIVNTFQKIGTNLTQLRVAK